MNHSVTYSLIVPLFNEEDVVTDTYRRIKAVMDSTEESYEILFINDGSRDKTSILVNHLCSMDANVKFVELSRNFGQQMAVTAGVDYCSGQAVIFLDADLQDPPEVIPEMICKWKEGYQVVYGKRVKREWESLFKRCATFTFYRILKKLTDVDIPVDVGDFRLIDRQVCNLLKTMQEKNRYVRGLISWLGFRTTRVEYARDARFAGQTHYSSWRLIRLGLDALLSFSMKPMKAAYYLGMLIILYNALSLIILKENRSCQGLYLVFNFILNGAGMIALGILGEYIGRIYDEAKHRPLYTVQSTVNIGKCDSVRNHVS